MGDLILVFFHLRPLSEQLGLDSCLTCFSVNDVTMKMLCAKFVFVIEIPLCLLLMSELKKAAISEKSTAEPLHYSGFYTGGNRAYQPLTCDFSYLLKVINNS